MNLSQFIRTIPDFPEPGIMFRDVTTLFGNRNAFKTMILSFEEVWKDQNIDYIAGIDARGFIIGGALAHHLSVGFVPVRKKGKLPYKTIEENYDLEYGTATLELHTDAVSAGSQVLVVDDLIATGGTAEAAAKLIEKSGGKVAAFIFVINLFDLGGKDLLEKKGYKCFSLIDFPGH